MTPRQWLPLIAIVICVFIVNMSEFMPIGLLTDIANDFDISESKAGLLISFYAWAVAILSLPIMLLLRKMEYRRMFLMTIAIFAFFQILSGISSSYGMLMASRIGVAVAHSIFWSIATPLAVRVVPPELQKLALSAVATGTSVAMIAGLPLGRVIGLALGWRMTFIVIAVVSIVALVLLVFVFPRMENPGTFTLKRLPVMLSNRDRRVLRDDDHRRTDRFRRVRHRGKHPVHQVLRQDQVQVHDDGPARGCGLPPST